MLMLLCYYLFGFFFGSRVGILRAYKTLTLQMDKTASLSLVSVFTFSLVLVESSCCDESWHLLKFYKVSRTSQSCK